MKKEKMFLKSKSAIIENEISELQSRIESLKESKNIIERKIKEEDIKERVLVMHKELITTNRMNRDESEGLLRQFLLVDESPKCEKFEFRFIRYGSKVICTVYNENKKEVGRGVSKCHYEDEFDYVKGVNIAEYRAMQDLLKRREIELY